jgi:glucokinase
MWNLVVDIGGTNMRFAAVSSDGTTLLQQNFPTNGPFDMITASANMVALQGSPPLQVVVAAAGVVVEGEVKLTNAKQKFSEAALAQATGASSVTILNDFEAAAWSLATLSPNEVDMLQGKFPTSTAPRLIIGPGTGLGVGAMIWCNGKPHVVSGEGGHITLAPQTAEEVPFFETLVKLWPDVQIGKTLAVEAEAILSGTGIPVFYQAVADAKCLPAPLTSTKEIVEAAKMETDAVAVTTMNLFRRYLGTAAGDLGLVFDAKGGVFITGGVALSNPWLFDETFLTAFNAGGRHSSLRKIFPVGLYHSGDFGLTGAQNYITER